MKLKFCFGYFIFTMLLFITEVFIGFFLHDAYIRPFGGDFLVVILLYCFVKSFFNTPVNYTAVGVLSFSYIIEVSQHFRLVYLLGLGSSNAAVIIMGSTFSWWDVLAYTLGIAAVVVIEQQRFRRSINKVYITN